MDHTEASELEEPALEDIDPPSVPEKKPRKKGARDSMIGKLPCRDSIKPVVIYEYQKTRNTTHPKEFLSDYKGWLCCDGYEGYHSLREDITVCGCMVHARRHYCNAVKALSGKKERSTEQTVSGEAIRRIADLFHTDNEWKEQGLGFEERLQLRQTVLKEKFDSYYAWVESMVGTVPPKSETGKGLRIP